MLQNTIACPPSQRRNREMMEEAGIAADAPLIALEAIASIPTSSTNASRDPRSTFVIERAFAARLPADFTIAMAREHTAYRWLPQEAVKLLRWDSNKAALCEFNE